MKSQQSSSPLSHRWFLFALLVGGTFFAYFHRSALSIAAPLVGTEFALSPTTLGVLLSAFFWTYALAQIPSGWMADRFGVGRVYTAGFVIWVAAGIFTGLASSFAVLLVLRLAMGLGQGIVFPGSARSVANWFPADERGGATAGFLAGVRIGQAVITAIGVGVIAVYGWRFFFIATSCAGIVWIVPWVIFHWRYERVPVSAEVAITRPSLADYLDLLTDRRLRGTLLAFFAEDYVWLLNATWVPGYFLTQRHFTAQEITWYISAPVLLTSVSAMLAGVGSDAVIRMGHSEVKARTWFIVGGMLLASSIGLVGAVSGGHIAGLLTALSLLGASIASPNLWALTQAIAGRERSGVACGLLNFTGNIAGTIAPILTGFIAQATGSFFLPFLFAGLLVLVCAAVAWAMLHSAEPMPRWPWAHPREVRG